MSCVCSVLGRWRCCLAADREVQRILLELLNQMDGFDQTVNVKVSDDPQTLINRFGLMLQAEFNPPVIFLMKTI